MAGVAMDDHRSQISDHRVEFRCSPDSYRHWRVAHDGPVILHCFSSQRLLEPALERGWYVSFAGNVTYKNAYDLRAAARRVPHDRLLAETDSPYLAPQAVRGKRNEPAYVVHTYDLLAQLHGDAIKEQIVANAERVFSL